MHVGLYFGSFNPIHNGHLIIAQQMQNSGAFDAVRFVVSPHNPFKNRDLMIDENLRLQMVLTAIESNLDFEASDAEFFLPKPSFTIQTISHFMAAEPENKFSIIMGSDNLEKLHEWKDINKLSRLCDFHIYRRRGSENMKSNVEGKFYFHEAPFLDISATFIREQLERGKSVRYLVPDILIPLLSPGPNA